VTAFAGSNAANPGAGAPIGGDYQAQQESEKEMSGIIGPTPPWRAPNTELTEFPVTMTIASPCVVTWTNHGLVAGNEKELDARVLEGKGWISHPDGLNWYHSHMHGISSDQVMGGLAGLLSVGEDKANVRAKCDKDPPNPEKCYKDTADLKKRTIVIPSLDDHDR
jgi:hypothetical protein